MFDKLDEIEKKYNELNKQICEIDPRSEMHSTSMKEIKNLFPIVDKYNDYKSVINEIAETEQLLSDKDLKKLAEQEILKLKDKKESILDELKQMLIPKDPDDDKNVIMEIRAGAGGSEACLFASSLFRMYSMYAQKNRWKVEVLNINETELGGIKEISFSISGKSVYAKLKFESGVHRVQRVPETESQGRIHTSTVTVAVFPEAEEVELTIDPSDLQIDTFRAGGAGGQHVNKTESAIRITHIPSGLVVECQDERSQYKNKDKAMKVLRARLLKLKKDEQDAAISEDRRSQVGTGDRSERIRTYNFPQNRVTDHRLKVNIHQLDLFLEGNLDMIY